MALTVRQALSDAAERLRSAELPGAAPRLEAERLLCTVLGVARSYCFAHPEAQLSEAQQQALQAFIQRRAVGEPLAYLTGEQEFWSLPLHVTPDVLIPRPETELLVEAALARLPKPAHLDKVPAAAQCLRIADLGTGSGAIALALAKERPDAEVHATDISSEALQIAQNNALRLKLGNVTFHQGSWGDALSGAFDLIASNPPYVAVDDPHLQQGDCRFEPRLALTAGDDELAAFRTIIGDAEKRLVEGGYLLMEHGFDQGVAVRKLLQGPAWEDHTTLRDLLNHERVTLARRSS